MSLSATLATLALMIGLQAPGMSPYSRVVLDTCDEECQREPVCDEPVIWCQPPRWSGRHQKYVRYESFDEGVHRYHLIADVMREVSEGMLWRAHDSCAAPGQDKDEDEDEGCEKLRRQRPWAGSERRLRLLLTTVGYHESTFRKDVHEGSTRGDCDYKEVDGRRILIEGSCRSHCLGQVKLEGRERTRRGLDKHQIVGLSRDATSRCVTSIVDRLSTARRVCVGKGNPKQTPHAGCLLGVYGGVTDWAKDHRITLRHKTYLGLARAKPKLDKRVRKLLGLDEEAK